MVAILITAGPTREYLDDVRYLSNGSSGRMGFALAEAALAAGHEAYLVLGPVESAPPSGAHVRPVTSAVEMQAAAEECFASCQIAIAAAAVADWRPAERTVGKPPRGGRSSIELVPNPDIVKGLAEAKGERVVVGFALEGREASMDDAVARGRDKLRRKGLDLVVCNRAAAIGSEDIEAALVYAAPPGGGAERVDLPRQSKASLAGAVVAAATGLWDTRRRAY